MNIRIAYEHRQEILHFPDLADVTQIRAADRTVQDEGVLLQETLFAPVAGPSLAEFLAPAGSLLIVVNDAARPTPTARVLEHLEPFIRSSDFRVIVATGAHKAPDQAEIKSIFGRFADLWRGRISYHDAVNSRMADLGITTRGTPVRFNALYQSADRIINITSVEPHYFAGFTGGRKSFLPGIAAYQSIESNHALALLPGADILQLLGNPVHEDMAEAARMINKPVFSINLVISPAGNILAAGCGDAQESFLAAAQVSASIFHHPCSRKFDLILAVMNPPLNTTLYQAHKGLENNRRVLKAGGTLILLAACREGIGPAEFYQLLSSCSSPAEVLAKIQQGYLLGYHKAARMADFMGKHQLAMFTSLEQGTLQKIFIRKVDNLQQEIDRICSEAKAEPSILINHQAGTCIPVLIP